jgi:hypothetical protein
MRSLITILLFPLFVVVFLIAITVNQIASTIASEYLIVNILDDAEIYEYVYDDLLPKLADDIVEREYPVKLGRDRTTIKSVLKFDNPNRSSDGLQKFVNDVVPREYIRREFGENLAVSLAYLRGDQDSFTYDLEIQDRIRAFPSATEKLFQRTQLADEIVGDVIVPVFRNYNSGILDRALGLSFEEDELEAVVFLLISPEWIEHHTTNVAETLVPYMAGDSDDFEYALRFEDRIVISGEILKRKLRNDDVLYQLVFSRMVRPLLGQSMGLAHSIGFDITLSSQEVSDVFEAISPREWVREQGDGITDELTAYLIGASDEINFTVDLVDRKDSATYVLTELVADRLRASLEELPTCATPLEAAQASEDVVNRVTPRCLAGNQESIDVVVDALKAIMRAEVENFVTFQVPDSLNYDHSYFTSIIGGNIQFVANLRKSIAEGVHFTEQDLLKSMGAGNSPSSQRNAQQLINIVSDGLIFTESDILGDIDSASLGQINDIRGYVATAMSHRWLIWLLILLPLLLMAYLAANRWSTRLKWAGAILALSAILVYAGISILWTTFAVDMSDRVLPSTYTLGTQLESDFPRLAEELKADGPNVKIMQVLEAWQERLKNQAVPWIFLGVLAFAIGTGWPSASTTQTNSEGSIDRRMRDIEAELEADQKAHPDPDQIPDPDTDADLDDPESTRQPVSNET